MQDALDPGELERALREDPTRPGKVGAVVAVGLHQRAIETARAIANRPHPSCRIDVRPGEAYDANLDIERRRGDQVVAYWREHRRHVRDASGRSTVASTATYQTEIGLTGVARDEWRIIGTDSYHATAKEDGLLWYRRDANDAEKRRHAAAATASLQALLDAAEGWSSEGAEWIAAPSGAALRCAEHSEGPAWIDRFVATATLMEGRLTASPARRELTASWRLSDGSVVSARFEDRVEPSDEPVEPPASLRIVDVHPDRSFGRAQNLVEKLAEQGVVTLASPPDDAPRRDDER